jgi:hypothetical protein
MSGDPSAIVEVLRSWYIGRWEGVGWGVEELARTGLERENGRRLYEVFIFIVLYILLSYLGKLLLDKHPLSPPIVGYFLARTSYGAVSGISPSLDRAYEGKAQGLYFNRTVNVYILINANATLK